MIRWWAGVSSAALLLLFAVVVYHEVSPEWKTHQERFNRLEQQRLRAAFRQAERRLQEPETREQVQALESERLRLRERFQKPDVQRAYHEAVAELRNLEAAFERTQDRLQRLRAEYQALEREYILASGEPRLTELRKRLESARVTVAQAVGARDEAKRQRDAQAAKVAAFTAQMEAVEQKLAQITAERKRLTADLAKIRARPLEIKQILLDEWNQADRCTTCHVGTVRDLFAGGPATVRRHPGFYLADHPVEKFGCAPCHGGQPRATAARAAHGKLPHWPIRLIPIEYLGGACGKCHREEELPFEPQFTDGRKLFTEAGCAGCHDVEGLRPADKIGPDLGRLGSKAFPHWLRRWLKNPRDYLPRTRMPNFLLTDQEVTAIEAFLRSVPGTSSANETPVSRDEQVIAQGKKIFGEARCISCHAVEGRGGTLAPELSRIAGKARPGWLLQYLRDPKKHAANSKMPRYRFSNQELNAVVAYMLAQFQDGEWPPAPVAQPPPPAGDPAQGRILIRKYGCYGCHDIPGFEKPTKVGAELNSYADKTADRLDFGTHKDIPKDWFAWTLTKLKSPRIFRDELKMPDYAFTDEEAAALTVFLRSLSEENIPPGYRAPLKPTSPYVPEGDFGRLVEDLNCLVCHTIRGKGGVLAPDLTWEGSRVRRDWLSRFLKEPNTIRLYMQERMPKFHLTDAEAETIVSYMKLVLVNPSIPEKVFQPHELTPALAAEGKQLYFEKYACQACHQLGLEGGAIGPELTQISQRLTEGWLLVWLQGSRKLVPSVKEPQYNMSEQEARAVAAFLLRRSYGGPGAAQAE
jgi:mono/diheme cytochrome c family protein